MSIKAPKRIYTGSVEMLSEEQLNHPDTKAFATVRRKYEDDIPYIRADIVDELVEALEDIRDYEFSHRYIKDITRAALKKLEENEDEMSPELREGMRKWAEARAINGLKELGRKRNG